MSKELREANRALQVKEKESTTAIAAAPTAATAYKYKQQCCKCWGRMCRVGVNALPE